MEITPGIFYGVGVGPGDPELITIKALRALEKCPVIASPRTKSGEMLALDIAKGAMNLDDKIILPLDFTMERDKEKQLAAHAVAAAQVAEHLAAGRDVAMLNLGDVSIYSTYSYLMERLQQEGFSAVMIPGVPSFCAVAACLGTSLTTMNRPLHIIPAGGGTLAESLDLPGTKVLMKSGKQMPKTVATLEEKGLLSRSAVVQDCGLPTQRICRDLHEIPHDMGYFSTIVVKE